MFSPFMPAGLNNNSYQISRGLYYNNNVGHGLTETCKFVKADFMKQPFVDGEFDAVYEIDATCHAPDQVGCYKVGTNAWVTQELQWGHLSSCHGKAAAWQRRGHI